MYKKFMLLVLTITLLCGCTYSEQNRSDTSSEISVKETDGKDEKTDLKTQKNLNDNNNKLVSNNKVAEEKEATEAILNEEIEVEESQNKVVTIVGNTNKKSLNEGNKSKNQRLEPLSVTIHLSTQNENTDIQLPLRCNLTEVHWSDDLLLEITPINDVALSDQLLEKLTGLYLTADCSRENNIIQILIPIEDKFELKSSDLNSVGYSLIENVLIESGYSKMKYNIIRYNKEHTEELFYTRGTVDDYLNIDIIFEEAQNKTSIEEALLKNLTGLDSEKDLPEVRFTWKDDYILNMYIANMEEKTNYYINFNGYVQPNGAIYHQVFSHVQVFDGLFKYSNYPGIYEFYKTPKQRIVDYNVSTLEEKQVGLIEKYSFEIGPIWSELNKIILGTYDEWGYYTFIYDYKNNQFISKDSLHTFYYENVRKKDKYAYVLLQSDLMKINMETSEVVKKVNNEKLDISVVKYNENINQLIALRYDYAKKSSYLILMDENLDVISETAIKYEPLVATYSAYYELYWVDDERVAIAGKEKNTINTYIYNIKSGNRNEVIFNEKIMSISPNYDYMIFQDLISQSLKIRDSNYEIIAETTLNTNLKYPLYQYYDFWYDNNFYLNLEHTNEIFIMEMESFTEKYIELPYKRTAILEIVDETIIRLVTDAVNIEKSSFSGK